MPAIQYQRILVPLDGSATAEAALSHAVHLARIERATLTLMFVITSLDEIRGFGGQIVSIDAMWETRRASALRYLHSVQTRPELSVIATHGYSGFKRWALGSVADKVLRASDHPVLLVNTSPPGGV